MKVLVKLTKYLPEQVGDEKIKLYLLKREELGWRIENKRRSKHVLDRLLAYANNAVITNMAENAYIFAEAEIPGMKAFVGEGGFKDVETILLPLPRPVNKVRIVRIKEGEKTETIHEYEPPAEMWGYESKITIAPEIEYDLIIIDTPEGPRPLFPDELKIPIRKTMKKRGKRKRRKSKKAGRALKKKRKRKSRRKK